jgi:hypothetical protein
MHGVFKGALACGTAMTATWKLEVIFKFEDVEQTPCCGGRRISFKVKSLFKQAQQRYE